MLNIEAAEQLMSNFIITHRDTLLPVPFVPNYNQRKCHRLYDKHLRAGRPLRVICVKARRTGFSSDAVALGMCHILGEARARAMISAHLGDTAEGLFNLPRQWAKGLPFSVPKPTERFVRIPHSDGESTLTWSTVGNIVSGRGLTHSFLLMSEAGYVDLPSFMSVVNTVSDFAPTSMVLIEGTANGQSGIGETFYSFWQDAEQGRSNYIPVFLTWLDDPECILNPDLAEDAPATDLERELMKDFNATKAQIAWMRSILYSPKCGGLVDVFQQEYPWASNVAFLASGNPAFETAELKLARSTLLDPIAVGILSWDGDAVRFGAARDGWRIWEHPDPKCHYYIGGDAARGMKEGDFAAAVVWNGTTGNQAAEFDQRIDPEALADELARAGNYWRAGMSPAKLNVELTGNLGLHSQRVLRDRYHYSNLYGWPGARNDKPPQRKYGLTSLGWETTYRSRERMIVTYRSDLAMKRLTVRSKKLLSQMESAQRTQNLSMWDFIVKKGHDDIWMAAMIGWIACADFPPPRIEMSSVKPQDNSDASRLRKFYETEETSFSFLNMARQHQKAFERKVKEARMLQ